jgi:hypothetical protein
MSSNKTCTIRRYVHSKPPLDNSGLILVIYLTDFNYFPLERNCQKSAGHSRNRSKIDNLKGSVYGLSYFSWFSVILFSKQNHPCDINAFISLIWVWFMVFNATFNNISVISWRSVLVVEETGENHRPASSHLQILSHIVVSSTPCQEQDIWCVPILWAYIILYVFIFPICLRSFGPYNIVLVTDRSIYCHMTVSAMNYLLYRMRYINVKHTLEYIYTYISDINETSLRVFGQMKKQNVREYRTDNQNWAIQRNW